MMILHFKRIRRRENGMPLRRTINPSAKSGDAMRIITTAAYIENNLFILTSHFKSDLTPSLLAPLRLARGFLSRAN